MGEKFIENSFSNLIFHVAACVFEHKERHREWDAERKTYLKFRRKCDRSSTRFRTWLTWKFFTPVALAWMKWQKVKERKKKTKIEFRFLSSLRLTCTLRYQCMFFFSPKTFYINFDSFQLANYSFWLLECSLVWNVEQTDMHH